jgi:thiol-disulfide isomerase/thioredoxin
MLLYSLAPPSAVGQPPTPTIVAYVIQALQHGDLAEASGAVAQYRRLHGDTPEALEALSWVARGDLALGQKTEALATAKEIERIAQTSLGMRTVDSEPHLPVALGAAYEIEVQALVANNQRAQALQMLRSLQRKWQGTSLAERMQKNINLLVLQGRPMPPLRETDWIGAKPKDPGAWRGKPLLIFFWAHWCADCKADAPIVAKLAGEFEPKGLQVIAPTRLYGYTAQDEHAPAHEEREFIDKVFEHYYAAIPQASVPLDSGNFERFGASTTPTIVLVNRAGIVQTYHPGAMDEASLRLAIEAVLASKPTAPSRERQRPG